MLHLNDLKCCTASAITVNLLYALCYVIIDEKYNKQYHIITCVM